MNDTQQDDPQSNILRLKPSNNPLTDAATDAHYNQYSYDNYIFGVGFLLILISALFLITTVTINALYATNQSKEEAEVKLKNCQDNNKYFLFAYVFITALLTFGILLFITGWYINIFVI